MLDLARVSTIFPYERERRPGGPWDVIVIGAGASAVRAAHSAATEGARVVMVREPDDPSARVPSRWSGARRAASAPVAWNGDVLVGPARFASAGVLLVGGHEVRARSFVVATGSVARRPSLPGLPPDRVLTADELGGVRNVPARVAVLGSGPTGLEVAQALARQGARVSVVDACPSLGFGSTACAAELERLLSREIEIRLGATVAAARAVGKVVELAVEDRARSQRLAVDCIVFALGRAPRLAHLALERAGVDLFAGAPIVDPLRRTSNARILYAGDEAEETSRGGIAERDAEIAGHNAARPDAPIATPDVPPMTIVFTDPPYARVGVDETTARVRLGEILVASRRFDAGGLMRIWTDRRGKLLGGEVVGPEGDLLVHLLSYAIHFGATADDIRRAEHGPKTLAETLWGLADGIAKATGSTSPAARARTETPVRATLCHDGVNRRS